jgi:hypothetical protein
MFLLSLCGWRMAELPGDGDQVEAEASREFLLRERQKACSCNLGCFPE